MGFKSGQFQDQSNNLIFFFPKKFLTTLLLSQGANIDEQTYATVTFPLKL